MNSASKVGEIFLAAGNSYSKLGDSIMSLYNTPDEQGSPGKEAGRKGGQEKPSGGGGQTVITKHPAKLEYLQKQS